MLPTSVSSCKKVFSLAPTPLGLVGSLFNESVPSHSRVGGGSTTLVGQLPIETKCPDPPANLFPPLVPLFPPLPSASDGRGRGVRAIWSRVRLFPRPVRWARGEGNSVPCPVPSGNKVAGAATL
jgi:hypothetical protein